MPSLRGSLKIISSLCGFGQVAARARDISSTLPVTATSLAGKVGEVQSGISEDAVLVWGKVSAETVLSRRVTREGLPGSLLLRPLAPELLTSCSTEASKRPSLSPYAGDPSLLVEQKAAGSSGNSWLTHAVRRRLHPVQRMSAEAANVQRIFRRLHSQQLFVPLRTRILFLGAWTSAAAGLGISAAEGLRDSHPGEEA
jgi:hypothetical protein